VTVRGPEGKLTYIGGRADKIAAMADMPLVEVLTGSMTTVGDCLKASN